VGNLWFVYKMRKTNTETKVKG